MISMASQSPPFAGPSTRRFVSDSARWAALNTHDPLAHSDFVYAVKTSMIYCRPTCGSRLARRANITFYDTAAEAAGAGYRPCKRCRPELERYTPQEDVIARARKTIEEAGPNNQPSLKTLATQAGLTKSHFHRVFKRIVGVTPAVYAENLRGSRGGTDAGGNGEGEYGGASGSGTTTLSSSATSGPRDNSGTPSDFSDDVDEDRELTHQELLMPFFDHEALSWLAHRYPSGSTELIMYTIQPWFASFVLIAVTSQGICALDTADSTDELLNTLHTQFPAARLTLSNWSLNQGPNGPAENIIFSTVMEALINPTGKILDVPFDVR